MIILLRHLGAPTLTKLGIWLGDHERRLEYDRDYFRFRSELAVAMARNRRKGHVNKMTS